MDNSKATLSINTYGIDTTITFPNSDVSTEDMVQAFFTAMIGATFLPSQVVTAMNDFVNKHRELILGDDFAHEDGHD